MNHIMLEFSEFLSKLEDELETIAASGRQSPGAFLKDFLPLAASKYCFIRTYSTQDLYRIEPRADAITFSHVNHSGLKSRACKVSERARACSS
jgi:hypothetical protein